MSKGKEPAAVPQSTDMTGEEETAVEDLVANAEDEEMTPVPESDIQLGDEEVETDVDMEEQEEQGEAEAEDIDGEEEVEGQGSVDSEEESEPIEEPYVEGQIGEFCFRHLSIANGTIKLISQYGPKVCNNLNY